MVFRIIIFFWGSSFKDNKGELFFGGINGFNSFYPDSVKVNRSATNPIISSIKIFETPLGYNYTRSNSKDIILAYNQNFLTFEFTGLDFIVPQKDLFKYKLEGVDEDWNVLSNRRYASYTNLSPGDYVMRLSVSNSDEVWNGNELILKITVNPPWWKTWWAIIAYVLLFIGGAWLFFHIRLGILESQKSKLEQQVALRTNEIAEKNSLLQNTLDQLEVTQRALVESEKMASLGILIAGVAHEINNPLNFISVSIDNIEAEIDDIHQSDKGFYDDKLQLIVQLVGYAKTGTSRIANIVKSLRQYSHTNKVEKQLTEVSDLVNNSITIIHSKLPSFAQLTVNLIDTPQIYCKQDQVSQVLINILDNAIDAISDKPSAQNETISIETSVIKYHKNNYLQIEISNSGALLPTETIKHLFDPFFTTKAPNRGTGMGLYISYNIIKDHSGFLVAENSDNLVKFKILLPILNSANVKCIIC